MWLQRLCFNMSRYNTGLFTSQCFVRGLRRLAPQATHELVKSPRIIM
jgi:hypothetical protein